MSGIQTVSLSFFPSCRKRLLRKEPVNVTLMRVLRAIRQETLDQIADSVGVHRSLVQQIEVLRADASGELRKRLADHYGLSWAILVSKADAALVSDLTTFLKARAA